MPEIARFYGIIIKIFFADHPPPHFHAKYLVKNQVNGEDKATGNRQQATVGISEQLTFVNTAIGIYVQLLIYGEYNALFSINPLEIIEGDLPERAKKMVIEWASLYQPDLLAMWNTQEFRKLPPLK